jgi:RNA-splicing ligase RtcB
MEPESPSKFLPRISLSVESEALNKLRNTANCPWVLGVSAMPDVHYGMGATVGR